jgi:hypothetical protein
LSAGLEAILKHKRVIIDDPASDRLLNASAVAAIDDDIIPTTNFPAKRSKFRIIPDIPLIIPNFVLTLGFLKSWFLQRIFSKRNLLKTPPSCRKVMYYNTQSSKEFYK